MVEVASIQCSTYALRKIRIEGVNNSIESSNSFSNIPNSCMHWDENSKFDVKLAISSTLTKRMVSPQKQHEFDKELSQRRLALLLYLIRSPLFDRYAFFCGIVVIFIINFPTSSGLLCQCLVEHLD